jgi:hypothetical protein
MVPGGLPLKEGFPPQALRWLDSASLWWLKAAKEALARGGEVDPSGVGQVVGLGWGPTTPANALISTVHREGFAAMPPGTFPYSVGNAPAGQAGILLQLRGPAVTLTAKESAGLAALVEACRFICAGAMDRCLAGGVDQMDPFLVKVLTALQTPGSPPPGEGAFALLLEAAAAAPVGALARVAAWCSPSAACAPHLYPCEPRDLYDRMLDELDRRCGWGGEGADLVVLPENTRALGAAGEEWRAARLPRAKVLLFQGTLGACGAAWAGAAVAAAEALASGEARRAVLCALATGGAAHGLALEAVRAQ